jgi:hypothetical protein
MNELTNANYFILDLTGCPNYGELFCHLMKDSVRPFFINKITILSSGTYQTV